MSTNAQTLGDAVGTARMQARGQGWPPALLALTGLSGLLLIANSYFTFVYAPMEATMGAVQRLFYFHVGAAWAGAVAFLVVLICGVAYLIGRKAIMDVVGHSAVEVGLALVTIAIVGGMVWGQYAWGSPWTWDPKLTSAAVMWLSYAAYLMLRQGLEDPGRRARFAAVYGIVAFASVVMTYYGVRWVESTIHPYVIGGSAGTAEGDFGLAPRMLHAMLFSFFTFTVVFVTLTWHRVRLELLSERVQRLKAALWARQPQ